MVQKPLASQKMAISETVSLSAAVLVNRSYQPDIILVQRPTGFANLTQKMQQLTATWFAQVEQQPHIRLWSFDCSQKRSTYTDQSRGGPMTMCPTVREASGIFNEALPVGRFSAIGLLPDHRRKYNLECRIRLDQTLLRAIHLVAFSTAPGCKVSTQRIMQPCVLPS